jgi:hypothetical protein
MARRFDFADVILRIAFALVLVLLTYNPTPFSYISWLFSEGFSFGPVPAIAGIALLIGWIVFLRATFLSLGWLGILLWGGLLAAVVWFFVDIGWLTMESTAGITWVILVIVAMVLGVGMSWSHIRRQISGVSPIDDVEE